MNILTNLKNLLISPRFMSFYWRSGSIVAVEFLSMLSDSLAGLGLPSWAVVILGLAIAEGTKAIKNLTQGKDMGFAPKK
jgi:hypothetical protein